MLKHRITALCCLFAFSSAAMAQDFFVYPKNDQSAQQQQKDEGECYVWSKNQSGFDPANPPPSYVPPPAETGPDGSGLRGAARGAAVGAIVGNSDDARTGAAVGAAVGTMRRRDRQRNQNAEREQAQQQEAAYLAEMHDRYNRAYKGCMEAREYTIS